MVALMLLTSALALIRSAVVKSGLLFHHCWMYGVPPGVNWTLTLAPVGTSSW